MTSTPLKASWGGVLFGHPQNPALRWAPSIVQVRLLGTWMLSSQECFNCTLSVLFNQDYFALHYFALDKIAPGTTEAHKHLYHKRVAIDGKT